MGGYTLYVCDECEDICISSEPDMHECIRKLFFPMTDTVRRGTSGISDMMSLAIECHKADREAMLEDEYDDSLATDLIIDAEMDRRLF